jgi:hypothetical protein
MFTCWCRMLLVVATVRSLYDTVSHLDERVEQKRDAAIDPADLWSTW